MNSIRLLLVAAIISLLSPLQIFSQRTVISLNNWDFSKDKSKWEKVSIPHDWAISGPFDKKWDLQVVAIEQNGEKNATEKSGRSGALPWIGKGYYRTTVNIPQTRLTVSAISWSLTEQCLNRLSP